MIDKHTIKTPYYVIHKNALNNLYESLNQALTHSWNNFIIGYSFKTNSFPWLIKYMKSKGCYAEVVSDDEYYLAQNLKFSGDSIIYNGPIKSKETFLEALKNRSIINIDSARELEWLLDVTPENIVASIGIRVNFDIESYCPGESQCDIEGGRFGFCFENDELKKVIDTLTVNRIKISGLHMHCSSKTRSLNIYKACSQVACIIKKKYNLDLNYIDIGGGFFGGMETKPQFSEYIELIAKTLKEEFSPENTTLIVEPGMCLVGSPVDYVTEVIDIKTTSLNSFVVTDGSRTNIDPLMKKYSYKYSIDLKNKILREPINKQVIVGFTCMEHDRLFTGINAPQLLVGDRITYHKVGAYTMSLTPLFIKLFPDVYVEENGCYTQIREKWKHEKILSLEME